MAGRIGPSGDATGTPQHRALGTASRAEILRLVRAADAGLTAADVVAQIGLHPSTVRAHLEQLVEAGLLMKARASDGAPGRPAWRYRVAAPEPAPGPYRILAKALLDHLAGTSTKATLQAGQAWGRQLASTVPDADGPLDAALQVLRGLGFDPEQPPAPAGSEIHLRACPFLDLVGEQPDVMCTLHAAMIRGVVRSSGAPRAEAALEPFAAPGACVVRLQLSQGGRP
jgi:predicted ArsR family transcriptional regulator